MGTPIFRFSLTHQREDIEFTNNSFDVSLSPWEQIGNPGGHTSRLFQWNAIGAARSEGVTEANTHAIGQASPFDSANGWHPGKYIVEIKATNASTGGSAPLQQQLQLAASQNVISLGASVSFLGTSTWDVGAGSITRRITFELDIYYKYIWFYFLKNGSDSGYVVHFTIEQFDIISAPNYHPFSGPDGWKKSVIKLDRSPDFHSLVEGYETPFVYFGSNGIQDGGIEFLKSIDQTYGYDAEVSETSDISLNDGGTFERIFSGIKDLQGMQQVLDNKMEVPTLREDIWTRFKAHINTPVDLSSATDLYGNTISPVEPIDINLPTQRIRQKYTGFQERDVTISYTINDNEYGQIDFADETLSEIKEKFPLARVSSSTRPSELFSVEFGGAYHFDIIIRAFSGPFIGSSPTDTNLQVRLQINDDTAIVLSRADESSGLDAWTRYSLDFTMTLKAKDLVRLYFFNNNAAGASYTFSWFANLLHESYLKITADTEFPSSDAKGYYLHDVFAGIIERICGRNIFYSEVLGRTDTNMRQYVSNGCFSPFVIMKGLQLRGYTLEEKPFFISFNQAWGGADPIFNLGLGYDTVSSEYVIRVEEKAHFYDKDNVSVYLDNARLMKEYDEDRILKTIEIGYRKWESEDISGIDDPQTIHSYSTGRKRGSDLTLVSDFIAASIAIEVTRRKGKLKDADYKYDNENFIIALNDQTVSPDRYRPATNEDFDSISGLLNSSSRYNSILTPLRNFLRWANYIGGCMQKYTTSSYKFLSGKGNYDMVSDYSFALGSSCLGVIADALTESQDVPLGPPSNYNTVFGFLHLPDQFIIEEIDLTWEQYKSIRDNRSYAIGVSQTSANHTKFFIKEMSYLVAESKASFVLWAAEPFTLIIPESQQPAIDCTTSGSDEGSIYDASYEAVLAYATSQGFTHPSTIQKAKQNALILDLKADGIWNSLDLLYVFATDGSRDFAKINWKSPGNFTATEVNTPTFTENIGFNGNALNSYMDTDWSPNPDAVQYTLDEGSSFCYLNNNISGATVVAFGVRGNAGGGLNGQTMLVPRNSSDEHAYSINSNAPTVGSAVESNGFFHIQRTASNAQRLFKEGTQVGSDDATATNSLSTRDLFLLALNANDTGAAFHSDLQLSVFGVGAPLTGKESALYTAWNTYFTSL